MDLNVNQMAEAHLKTVEKTISDLEIQTQNIFQEIKKLKEYYEAGRKSLEESAKN